jgi:PPOX class probable F420-dependent enzyme
MKQMTKSEWREFVTEGGRLGNVAVTRADGRPHVTPVWFVLDGDDLVFSTEPKGVKGKSVLRDSSIAVCVNDEKYPYAFVLIEGEASTSSNPDEHRRLATQIGQRYAGPDGAAAFADHSVARHALVRIRITKVTARNEVAVQ